MEALISALQSFNLDLKDPHVSSAISTLTTRLDADRALTAEQEAYLATITHAVICKTATSPGGESHYYVSWCDVQFLEAAWLSIQNFT